MSARVRIAVPCFDEARRLDRAAFDAFLSRPGDVDLVLVDDGSTDGTGALLEGIAAAHPERAAVLRLPRNQGKGEAVRRGILLALESEPSAVGYWDADLSTPLEATSDLLGVLATRPAVELVFGSRVRLLGRTIERRAARHYVGRAFATAVSLLFDLPVYDTQCGAKLLRNTPRVRESFAEPFLSRWLFDVELVARFLAAGAAGGAPAREAIFEYPLHVWRHVGGSKLGPADYLRALNDLARIARAYRGSR